MRSQFELTIHIEVSKLGNVGDVLRAAATEADAAFANGKITDLVKVEGWDFTKRDEPMDVQKMRITSIRRDDGVEEIEEVRGRAP